MHSSSYSLVCIWIFQKWEYYFHLKILFNKIICLGLYYTQYNILMFAKFELCICLIYLYLLVWIWMVVVCSNYFISGFLIIIASHKSIWFKNTKILHKGVKQTFVYFVFYPLSKIILFHYFKVAWNLHSTNQNFTQLETERLSIPPVLQNKGLVA